MEVVPGKPALLPDFLLPVGPEFSSLFVAIDASARAHVGGWFRN
jgi:hypothetical protein